jgi:hypothetical protein
MARRNVFGKLYTSSGFTSLVVGAQSSSAHTFTATQLDMEELTFSIRLKDDSVSQSGNPGGQASSNVYHSFNQTTRYIRPGAATTNTVGLSGNPGEVSSGGGSYYLFYD